ncbi:serine protease [Caballeronia fortuita]|uniref:Serine protease n=1 Tax=Caballeronia fortuita TaxID=1777138 RepID=A0A158E0P2_9BURK|nr:autotransporter domain-containing protein [Caballeronia fortuita]SAL00461.1 serine protease [Caballeronia fortuita]
MNHVYRIVWSASLGAFQVVSELAHAHGAKERSPRRARRRLTMALRAAAGTAALAAGSHAHAMTLMTTLDLPPAPQMNLVAGTPASGLGWSWDGHNLSVESAQSAGTPGTLTNQGESVGTVTNAGNVSIANNSGLAFVPSGTGSMLMTMRGSIASIVNQGSMPTLTNNGDIGAADGTAIANSGVIGSLSNIDIYSGTISGAIGVGNTGTIGSFYNSSVVMGTQTAILNDGGQIGTLTNEGTSATIGGGMYGIVLGTIGSIDTLQNSGLISGAQAAIVNRGTIGTLTNAAPVSLVDSLPGSIGGGPVSALPLSMAIAVPIDDSIPGGTIQSAHDAIDNAGSIGALINGGSILAGNVAINNAGTIGTLTNAGTISSISGFGTADIASTGTLPYAALPGSDAAIFNTGHIGTLANQGTISGEGAAIVNTGSIGTFANDGLIDGGNAPGAIAIVNSGTIGSLSNSGTIGSLANSGTITGSAYAISNSATGTLGPISNAGVIAGNIINASANAITLSGASGAAFGTLTGFNGAPGTISSTVTGANVVLSSGNLLLDDTVQLGSNTLRNVAATLAVDRPVAIAGNYTQGAAATLLIGVNSGATSAGSIADTGYGRLVVSGNASIDAGSAVTLRSTTGGYAFAAGQRYVVVDAAGAGHYNAGALNYAIAGVAGHLSGSTVTTSNGHTDLVVTVDRIDTAGTTPTTPATPATTPNVPGSGGMTEPTPTPVSPLQQARLATLPNAKRSLAGLLSYTGVDDANLLNLYNATLASLASGSTAAANHIGQQLTPVQATHAAAASTFDALGVVNARVSALRLAQSQGATGIATGDSPSQWTGWGQAFGGHASQNRRDGVDGYSANYGGLLVGADRAVGERWRVGGVFDYAHTAVNYSDDSAGDSAGINAYGLIGYASYTGSPWYVNFSGAATLQHFDTTRIVSMTGFDGLANGSFTGQQYVLHAEAGYPLALGSMTLTPLASLSYSYQHQNGYTESGGNGAALSVGSTHASSVRSALGAKIEKAFSTSYGTVVPDLRAQWIHEYDHTRQTTGASFSADPAGQTAFTTVGATPVSDLADVSLGVTLVRASNLSVTARYELQAGSGFISHTGLLRLQQRF